ncbi:MAG: translation elongation factor Ts [Bacteroidota bacterium]|nr:translation elongation factor Ts [Bacteroidota bacterium]MDE2835093.1 translation elongation factor Ts [Bacteroidota bacterium]MDE2956346.1 translation elongation factor Ts [Bacteroidota bacterium]
MAITAKDVKKLRQMTGAGMMDCKRALSETGGNFDAAIDLLRKKGQRVAAKRAGRQALQGLVLTRLNDAQTLGAIVEVNCETDFVARNDEFEAFAGAVADAVLNQQPADMEALLALPLNGGSTVQEALTALIGKIGEKMGVRRFKLLSVSEGQVVDYIHPGARLGVLVAVTGTAPLQHVGRDVAMQVAALNPIAARIADVPADVQEKELEIGRESARLAGKPERILDMIAQGKLKRFFKDNVLVEQAFVKDASKRVRDVLKEAGAQVHTYVRFALGD